MEMLKVMQDFGHQPSKTTTLVYFAMRVHIPACADDALYVASETLVRRSVKLACAVFYVVQE